MRFGSVCSGIEAASVAWHPLGWKAAWLSEIEPFPSAVLKHHYPDVPNLGDMTTLPDRILSGEVEAPDLFCGGTPCQAFSVAGLRKSLDDVRGNLSLIFCEIANAIDHVRSARGEQPCIIFWENVPGVLNTKDNAFGCFLAGVAGDGLPLLPPGGRWTNAGCVHGPQRTVAWRVLDAQYFGVAQRRRRVFVVASSRNDFDPISVLFEFEGVRRDSAPSREAGQNAAKCLTAGAAQRLDFETEDFVTQPFGGMSPVAGTLTANTGGMTRPAGNANELDFCVPVVQPIAFPANLSATQHASTENLSPSLGATNPTAVAQPIAWDEELNPTVDLAGTLIKGGDGGRHAGVAQPVTAAFKYTMGAKAHGIGYAEEQSPTLDTKADSNAVLTPTMAVRRLTPVECERLQGFPDNYTNIPWRKAAEAPDGPRYKALGNSWAVPVVRWIGKRIQGGLN